MAEPAFTGTEHPSVGSPPRLSLVGRLISFVRLVTVFLSVAYAVGLLIVLVALEWWGESNWVLSLLLFAPAPALLLPELLLFPLSALLRPRLLIVHTACILAVCFGYMTFRHTARPMVTEGALKLVTHNIGQGDRTQFLRFIETEKPDVILMQDARTRGPDYFKTFPDRYVAGRGEFFAVSRHLIRRADLLPAPQWRGRPIAARFELEYGGRLIAVYNVHLPTPRSQFNRFLSKAIFTDLMGDEENNGGLSSYREWIDARRKLARELADIMAAEKLPFVACGDFNMPDHGSIYHTFADRFADAHRVAGKGWGMTFPGDLKGLTSRFAPWLRIDFAFAGSGWNPIYCEANPRGKAQHRAVLAIFEPKSR